MERTKPIDGYEEQYEISIDGTITNIKTKAAKKPTLAANGYLVIVLYKNNKGKQVYIHRLLAQSFIPNLDNLPTVNHKDGIKTNNNLNNLEWCSYGNNNKHAYDTGLKKATLNMMKHANNLYKSSLEKNPFGANRNPIIAIKGDFQKEFPSVEMAAKELGFSRGSIDKVLKGKRESSKGYTFKYLLGEN